MLLSSYFAIGLITLIALVLSGLLSWPWITGFVVGNLTSFLSIYFIKISADSLIKTENHYFFVFLFLLRVGFYMVVTLLVLMLPDLFSIEAFLIGIVNSIFYPFFIKKDA
ncbi:MG406 family protein [Spiroplasma endosymbiont of Panorpa germanica]|uniref:MG406 family protein n=1 Tax=Spiroplasma endosymbiont of Panorpa germanica TaxID=3066314 RepID=UPI003BAE186C